MDKLDLRLVETLRLDGNSVKSILLAIHARLRDRGWRRRLEVSRQHEQHVGGRQHDLDGCERQRDLDEPCECHVQIVLMHDRYCDQR